MYSLSERIEMHILRALLWTSTIAVPLLIVVQVLSETVKTLNGVFKILTLGSLLGYFFHILMILQNPVSYYQQTKGLLWEFLSTLTAACFVLAFSVLIRKRPLRFLQKTFAWVIFGSAITVLLKTWGPFSFGHLAVNHHLKRVDNILSKNGVSQISLDTPLTFSTEDANELSASFNFIVEREPVEILQPFFKQNLKEEIPKREHWQKAIFYGEGEVLLSFSTTHTNPMK